MRRECDVEQRPCQSSSSKGSHTLTTRFRLSEAPHCRQRTATEPRSSPLDPLSCALENKAQGCSPSACSETHNLHGLVESRAHQERRRKPGSSGRSDPSADDRGMEWICKYTPLIDGARLFRSLAKSLVPEHLERMSAAECHRPNQSPAPSGFHLPARCHDGRGHLITPAWSNPTSTSPERFVPWTVSTKKSCPLLQLLKHPSPRTSDGSVENRTLYSSTKHGSAS